MWTQQLCDSKSLAEILIRPNDFDITNKVEDATPDSEIEIDSEPPNDTNTNTANNDLQNDSKEVNNRPDFLTIFYWIIIKKGWKTAKFNTLKNEIIHKDKNT